LSRTDPRQGVFLSRLASTYGMNGRYCYLTSRIVLAKRVSSAGLEVQDKRQVLTIESLDRPGEGGKLFRLMTFTGVNVDLVYFSTTGKLILGSDGLEKVKATL
jgi:hypothetical protein